jgi:hypothetical protein
VPKAFSPQTLEKFEAASASIPLRQLDRAFAGADIRLGKDPGGPDGTRRVQFRRYVASVDQRDPRQLDRLGAVLGALIDEVATSKQEYLVKAAERDGFSFAGGVFTPAGPTGLASIAESGKRLQLLADDSPEDAVAGAIRLVESVCRTALLGSGERKELSSRDARVVVAAAVTFAGFLTDTFVQRRASKKPK